MYGNADSAANKHNHYSHLHHDHHQNQHQQQQLSPDAFHHHQSLTPQQHHRSGGGLTRFSSAPTSFFQTLLDHDDIISGFIASSRSDDIQQQQPPPPPQQSFIIKHETHRPTDFDLSSTTGTNGFSTSRNGGGLLRQSSSPADFFSGLDAAGFPSYRGNNTQAPHTSHDQPLPSIAVFQQNDSINGSLAGIFEKSDSYAELNWQGKRRSGDSGNEIMFGVPNELRCQNGYTANASSALIHQMSLPNTSSELAATEKYLQFQDSSTPCSNTRAKRGFATHPRSIAERDVQLFYHVRRTKISDRMRKLQQLFPDIDKQTNTAQMLDMATDYIKDLEKEVQSLRDFVKSAYAQNGSRPPFLGSFQLSICKKTAGSVGPLVQE